MTFGRRFFSRVYWRVRARRLVTRFVHRTAVGMSRLPLVAVTGTNGKTAVTLLISRILCDAGYPTGCACTEGVLADGEWIVRGDEAGSRGLWLPVSRSSMEHTLATFGRDPHDLPGRMQLFRYEGAEVFVSSSKNPETYAQEIPLLQRLARAHGYRRVICVVSNVGNRDRAHFQAVSRAVAALGDLVVCVPPYPYLLRGRTGDEIARLLESEVPAAKIVRTRATRLPDMIAELQRADSPSTSFVGFASRVSSAIDVDDIVARGEPMPMRFGW